VTLKVKVVTPISLMHLISKTARDRDSVTVGHHKLMKSFICRGCVNAVTGTGRTNVDIGGDANLQLVDKFCYLGDTLSVDGYADAAVEIRLRIGWNKSRQLVSLLTNKDISLTVREILQQLCAKQYVAWK